MPFRSYYLDPSNQLQRDLSETELREVVMQKSGLLWVDVAGTTTEDGEMLRRVFQFHPLAIEDCTVTRAQPPKIDDFGEHIFLIAHGIDYHSDSEIVETNELDLFISEHFVVTNHIRPMLTIDDVRSRIEQDNYPMQRGADFLAHELLDGLVDRVSPTIQRMSEVMDEVEEDIIREPSPHALRAIMRLKRSTSRIQRLIATQRETFNRLARGDFQVTRPEARAYYRDVYDHIITIGDLNVAIRDRAEYGLSTYFAAVGYRQNETMKTLAVVASVFLPLTLLTGIYGMNFRHMPELGWIWMYPLVWGIIATTLIVTVWIYFGRRITTRGARHAVRFSLRTLASAPRAVNEVTRSVHATREGTDEGAR